MLILGFYLLVDLLTPPALASGGGGVNILRFGVLKYEQRVSILVALRDLNGFILFNEIPCTG